MRDEQGDTATQEVELAAAFTSTNPLQVRGQSDRPENKTSELVFWESPLLGRDHHGHASIVMAEGDSRPGGGGGGGGDDGTTQGGTTLTADTSSIEALSALADSLTITVDNAELEDSTHHKLLFDASALQQRHDAIKRLVQLGEFTYV